MFRVHQLRKQNWSFYVTFFSWVISPDAIRRLSAISWPCDLELWPVTSEFYLRVLHSSTMSSWKVVYDLSFGRWFIFCLSIVLSCDFDLWPFDLKSVSSVSLLWHGPRTSHHFLGFLELFDPELRLGMGQACLAIRNAVFYREGHMITVPGRFIFWHCYWVSVVLLC